MEKIKDRHRSLILSQEAFTRALALYQSKFSQAEKAEREAYLASIIKHFELLYDMLWKYLKFYLMEEYGIETSGSKSIFRACQAKGLIDEKMLDQLLEIVELRNTTTHVYDEAAALKISKAIIEHYEPIKKLIEKFLKQ
jgi:nucleotidyltransferase substrate binding protein (TIGR01987 family)